MTEPVVIVVPWVPDRQCNPNNHRCSERTKIRHRKEGAAAAGYPMKAVLAVHGGDGPLFDGPVVLDVEVRWGFGQRSWDTDNLVTALKYVRDALQTFEIVANDRQVVIGNIVQVRATGQPATVLTVREGVGS